MAWVSFIVFQRKATFKIDWRFKQLLTSQILLLFCIVDIKHLENLQNVCELRLITIYIKVFEMIDQQNLIHLLSDQPEILSLNLFNMFTIILLFKICQWFTSNVILLQVLPLVTMRQKIHELLNVSSQTFFFFFKLLTPSS